MDSLKATEIFTPSDFPRHTYVKRDEERLERRLRDALDTPGEVISISGPSKSGKTVLVERVVGENDLITVTGAGLRSGSELWGRLLDDLEVPSSVTESDTGSHSGTLSAGAAGEVAVPLLAKGSVEGQGSLTSGRSRTTSTTRTRYGLLQVVKEIGNSSFVLLVDDFHYMPRESQAEVAKEIKEAARQGVKIVTASVPHRSDDVVRGNPELRGRVRAIDSEYWKESDLRRIAEVGFPLLNISVDDATIAHFAVESAGSPQLMQAICLQACFSLNVRETLKEAKHFDVGGDVRGEILEETSTRADYSSLVSKCHRGPKTRGTERKEFTFSDGTVGDVYRAVLLALADDPPRSGFTYSDLSQRVAHISPFETPQPASIYQVCAQIAKMALDMCPDQRVIEWDEDESILDIVDPYFLFYLRSSDQLAQT